MPRHIRLFLVAALAIAALVTVDPAQAADGDAEIGKKNFRQCSACHELTAGRIKVGPPLNGIVGRKAGIAPGFAYSPGFQAVAAKGLVWTEDNLIAYLENPGEFLKALLGTDKVTTKMYNRYRDEGFRRDVVAYLKEAAK